MQIYFLNEFSVCCHPHFLLPWQHDVTTSPLYSRTLVIKFFDLLVAVACIFEGRLEKKYYERPEEEK